MCDQADAATISQSRRRSTIYQKVTPEEWAQRERTHEMVRERIAYHEARAREEEERKRKAADSA